MEFNDTISELGYEIVRKDDYLIIIKKKDDLNIADTVIMFDTVARCISGGLITLTAIRTLDDIAHQYAVFMQFEKDLKKLASLSNYEII